ncbi:MAG: hypothetical protein Q8R28_16450 [Dehalococcoidia bacterium]|nr:hypothetical protein [Dehalococcoidia bacterium]
MARVIEQRRQETIHNVEAGKPIATSVFQERTPGRLTMAIKRVDVFGADAPTMSTVKI